MNIQKYIVSSVVAAVFIFFYGWVVYDMLLADYVRGILAEGSVVAGSANVMYIALGCLVQGFGLGFLYTKGHEDKGAMEGVRFGLYVGLFILGVYILKSGFTPFSLRAAITFGILDTIMYVGAGVCFAMVYKK